MTRLVAGLRAGDQLSRNKFEHASIDQQQRAANHQCADDLAQQYPFAQHDVSGRIAVTGSAEADRR
jgi:hypothetical protein